MGNGDVDLTGKVAFVTGGGSGIGRAFALQMARDGAAVAVTDLNGLTAADVAAGIAELGGQSLAQALDVRDVEGLEAAVDDAIARFGHIDFLFANAGVLGPADYLDITPDDWDLVLDVNLKGVALTCRALVSHFMERRQGRILITSSSNAVRAGAHVIPYRVSKAALLTYTRCLALVVAPYNVTVNAICPGVTLTPTEMDYIEVTAARQGITPEEYIGDRAARVPMQRFTKVADLAGLAEFLVSDSASFITSQAIAVDGGMMLT